MRRSMTILALVSAVAALALLPAAAQGRGPHGPGGLGPGGPGPGGPDGPGMLDHLVRALDLSAEQQAQVTALFTKYMGGAMGEKSQTLRDARATLAKAIHDPDATDQQVQDAAAAVSAIEGQIAVEQHHMALEVLAVLTPEQRAKFTDFVGRRHGPPPAPPAPPAQESGS
ncbi:MAG: periplasmic heavy metal sensor [Acidobacteria bacterium]|nr:periplasmic heavy metal sensor [Acidobacteriota bacterium]